jgi:hypothetical protein
MEVTNRRVLMLLKKQGGEADSLLPLLLMQGGIFGTAPAASNVFGNIGNIAPLLLLKKAF